MLDTTWPKITKLATSLEVPYNSVDAKSGSVFEGWFKAPETGEYRFYISADDEARLYLDSVNPYNAATPATISFTEIANSWYSQGYREYIRIPTVNDGWGKSQSDWITLQAGKYYKIRALHSDTGGAMHFNAAVEFKKANTNNHPMTTKAVQNLRIEHENTPE